MFNQSFLAFTLILFIAPALYAQTPSTTREQSLPPQPGESITQPEVEPAPILREYRGVRLGMTQDEVKSTMGKASQSGKDWDEFKLGGDNLMTVRYDGQHLVRTIQLYFADPKRAPSWAEVVGKAEIQEKPDGSRHARAENRDENFWVTMFQNKSGAVTTITLSR